MVGIFWSWLVWSDAGLLLRIAAVATILGTVAWWDWRRKGAQARRWREYLFLLMAIVVTIAFAASLDQVTVTISWEYFYFGKELYEVLGPQSPPSMMPLRLQAALVGAKAALAPGLLIGVGLLFANNPRKKWREAPWPRLYRALAMPLFLAATCAAIGGVAGYAGWLTWTAEDFREMAAEGLMRPRHFMATWGAHLGAYVGGALGAILALVGVLRWRRAHPTELDVPSVARQGSCPAAYPEVGGTGAPPTDA